jgi:hypothetical protein
MAAVASLASSAAGSMSPRVEEAHIAEEAYMATTTVEIPKSIQVEHEEIHATLVEATTAPGRLGAAARELAQVLHPHFVREEEIALPPLGLLAPLAARAAVAEPVLSKALEMTDALKAELPRMLEEHKGIRAAVEKLGAAARAEQAVKYEKLAQQLALHAQTEEDVFYPAAVLVGEIIRGRQKSK